MSVNYAYLASLMPKMMKIRSKVLKSLQTKIKIEYARETIKNTLEVTYRSNLGKEILLKQKEIVEF